MARSEFMPKGIFDRPDYRPRGERSLVVIGALRDVGGIASTCDLVGRTNLTATVVNYALRCAERKGTVELIGKSKVTRGVKDGVWRLTKVRMASGKT